MILTLLLVPLIAATTPPNELSDLTRRITACYEKHARPWLNGSYELDGLQDGEYVFIMSGPLFRGSARDIAITRKKKGQYGEFILFMIEAGTGTLNYATSSDRKRPQFEPDGKGKEHRTWFMSELLSTLRRLVPLCEALNAKAPPP